MKNWMLAVAGLILAAGMFVSNAAQAEYGGVNVGVRVTPVFAPVPMPFPPMGGGSHGFGGGFYPGSYPPPIRPWCGFGMRPMPYPYMGPGFAAPGFGGCYPWRRPRRRGFSMAIRIGGFGFAINTGGGYY